MTGNNSSAMAIRASEDTDGWPAALAAVFCSLIAWRTAGIPPRSNCSATGSCSGRSVANAALRCTAATVGRKSRRPVGRSGRCPRVSAPSRAAGRRAPLRSSSRPRRGPSASRLGPRSAAGRSSRPSRPSRAGRPSRPGRPSRGGRPSRPGRPSPRGRRSRSSPSRSRDPGAGGERDHDAGLLARCADDLDSLDAVTGAAHGSRGRDRDDLDAVEARFDLCAHDVADLAARGHEVSGHRSRGLACTGRPPCPRTVGGLAGQLDVCVTRHSIAHATKEQVHARKVPETGRDPEIPPPTWARPRAGESRPWCGGDLCAGGPL